MRYPVVNLRRVGMGGLLEDYQNDINSLKAKLNAQRSGFAGYTPPPNQYPPAGPLPPPPPPPPPPSPGPQTFHPPQPPMVATGHPPPPNPNDITVYQPPAPEPPPPSGPSNPFAPYAKVATGIPPMPYGGYVPPIPGPEEPGMPPIKPPPGGGSCPEGTTWTPSGCLPNTPSIDRSRPLSMVSPTNPTVPTMAPNSSVNSQPSWNTAPGATGQNASGGNASVPTTDCGPGKFWDGTQCRGSVGSMPTMPGGFSGQTSGPVSAINPGAGAASGGGSAFMGRVRLRSSPSLMAPVMLKIVGPY